MADTKVTALTALTTPQPSDELLIVDNSGAPISKRITRQYLLGYTEYVALVSQAGANAPTAVDIKNDTGATVTWSRLFAGVYRATFSSAVLTADKTICRITNQSVSYLFAASWSSTSVMNIYTANLAGALTDGELSNSPITIRIYV
jgi:hypothetical protein